MSVNNYTDIVSTIKDHISNGNYYGNTKLFGVEIPYDEITCLIALLQRVGMISDNDVFTLMLHQHQTACIMKNKLDYIIDEKIDTIEKQDDEIEELKGKLEQVRDYADSIIDECDY